MRFRAFPRWGLLPAWLDSVVPCLAWGGALWVLLSAPSSWGLRLALMGWVAPRLSPQRALWPLDAASLQGVAAVCGGKGCRVCCTPPFQAVGRRWLRLATRFALRGGGPCWCCPLPFSFWFLRGGGRGSCGYGLRFFLVAHCWWLCWVVLRLFCWEPSGLVHSALPGPGLLPSLAGCVASCPSEPWVLWLTSLALLARGLLLASLGAVRHLDRLEGLFVLVGWLFFFAGLWLLAPVSPGLL